MRLAQHSIPLMFLAFAVASCVTRADIDEIKKNQKEILSKIGSGGARPTPPARRRGPDPAKTYAFPVGDAPTKGPKDAWVTIVEISDFQ